MTPVDSPLMHVSFFEHKQDNRPRCASLRWDALANRLMQHAEREDKDGPLWSPAKYGKEGLRGNNWVLEVCAAVGDFDNGVSWEEVKARLERYEYVVHSTHSFDPEHPKFRVAIPFASAIPTNQWPGMKARIDHHVFGLASDPVAKDAARLYYLPSCPPGMVRFAERHSGEMLDPTTLPGIPVRERTGGDVVTNGAGLPLGKTALDFVANGAPIHKQRARAVAAARNYLSAGYSVNDTAAAIWRGLQVSPLEDGKCEWMLCDAFDIASDIASKPAPLIIDMTPTPTSVMTYLEEEDDAGCLFRKSGMGYAVTFTANGLTVMVDQLRRSGGELRAEVLIHSTIPAAPKHLYWGGLILSSGANREKLGHLLKKRTAGHDIDWDGILEVVCRKVAVAERQGDPFQTAGDMPEEENKLDWLIAGIVPRLEPTVIFGDGGVGKSMLSLAIALSVRTGIEIVPGFVPAVTGNVLYLDWEASRQRLDSRIKRICRGVGIDPICIGYRRCTPPLVEQVEEVLRYCQSESVVVVVIDSVEMAMNGTGGEGGDPNDKVIRLHSALRMLGATTILVDHVSAVGRSQKEGAGKAIGGIFKQNLARMVFELRKAQEITKKDQMNLGMFNLKRNDDGALLQPVGLRVEFSPDSTRYCTDGLSDTNLLAGLYVKDRLMVLLKKHGQASNKELAELAGATKVSVDTALSRGLGTLFTKLPTGNWGLLVRSAQEPMPTHEEGEIEHEEIPF